MASSVVETRSTNAAGFLSCRTNTLRIPVLHLSWSPVYLSASSKLHYPYRTEKGEGGRGEKGGGKLGQGARVFQSREFGDRLYKTDN